MLWCYAIMLSYVPRQKTDFIYVGMLCLGPTVYLPHYYHYTLHATATLATLSSQ